MTSEPDRVEVYRQALQTWDDRRYKNSSPEGMYVSTLTKSRWFMRYGEHSLKVPGLRRWGFVSFEGNGHLLSLGLGFSLGRKTGTVVLTLPFVELSVGYTDSAAGGG